MGVPLENFGENLKICTYNFGLLLASDANLIIAIAHSCTVFNKSIQWQQKKKIGFALQGTFTVSFMDFYSNSPIIFCEWEGTKGVSDRKQCN